jgi:hypothetical protein
VAAIDSSDLKASFSNYGATTVDLGAPGVNINSTVPGGYGTKSGTSMATPHVAGVAALLYGLNPTWTYQQVRDAILDNVRPLSSLAGKTVTGGTLDAAAALGGGSPPPPPPTSSTHLNNLAGSSSSISNKFWRASFTFTVHDENHQPVANATVSGTWSGGTSGSATCTTNSSGQCTVTKNLQKSRVSNATMTLNNVTHASKTYNAAANEDSTTETVNKP